MATVGSLVVDLIANTASFVAGLANARSETTSFAAFARGVKFEIGGNLDSTQRLTQGISEASSSIQDLVGEIPQLQGIAGALDSAASSASATNSAMQSLLSSLNAIKTIGGIGGVVGLGAAAYGAVQWGMAQDAKTAEEQAQADADRRRKYTQYRDWRMGVEMEGASVPWSTELANKATQERAKQDAIAARRAITTGQIDSVLNPLKAANDKAGMSPGDAAAYDMRQMLLEPLRQGTIEIADFRDAVARARIEADKKATFDAQQLTDQQKAAAEMKAAQEEASLIARIKENGMSDFDKFQREKEQIEALQRTDKITAEEASKAIANSSSRLLRNAGGDGQLRASALGTGTPGGAALTFGTNQAFTAEVNKSTDTLQQILLEERLQRAENKRAADKLADMKPATVFTFTA